MHIKEVVSALQEGKKIRHSSWEREDYIAIDKKRDNQIYFYRLEALSFHVLPDTLLSTDWYTIDKSHTNLDFIQALSLLAQGAKLKHDDMLDDIEGYIEMDLATKAIYARKITKREFTIDHKSLFSTEWMEVK